MITPELVSYVRRQQELGTPLSVYRKNLIAQGWNGEDIQQALNAINQQPISPIPVVPGGVPPLQQYVRYTIKKHPVRKFFSWFFVILVLIILGFEGYNYYEMNLSSYHTPRMLNSIKQFLDGTPNPKYPADSEYEPVVVYLFHFVEGHIHKSVTSNSGPGGIQ